MSVWAISGLFAARLPVSSKVGALMIDRVSGQPAIRQFLGSEVVGAAFSKLHTASTKLLQSWRYYPQLLLKCWRDWMLLRRVVFVVLLGLGFAWLICPLSLGTLGPCWLALRYCKPNIQCCCGTPEFLPPAIVLMIRRACCSRSSG